MTEAAASIALGDKQDSKAERKELDACLSAIAEQGRKLAGLRARVVSMSPDIEAAAHEIRENLPEHKESLRRSFSQEWQEAVSRFGTVLGKRVALEGLIGKLDLPNPSPAAVELPESANAPFLTLEKLQSALSEIAGWSQAAIWPEVDRMTPGVGRPFDSNAVYIAVNPASGFPVGTLLVDASVPPGTLEHLHLIAYVQFLGSEEWKHSLEHGRRAAVANTEAEVELRRQQQRAEDETRFAMEIPFVADVSDRAKPAGPIGR